MIHKRLPLLLTICIAIPCAAQVADSPSATRAETRYTFSWPVGSGAPAPRGGTTNGVPTSLETEVSFRWTALQEAGLSARERDRRAILAMAGSYRVSFDFLEIATFSVHDSRARPYQSWGTERVFLDRDDPDLISLVHILEMHVVDADGKTMPPMVTKHWRQEWRYEPARSELRLGRWVMSDSEVERAKRRASDWAPGRCAAELTGAEAGE